jgi:hypothetical protein
MNDMERRKFEDSFKDAFDEAQVTPSENVWTNIELDLEKAEGGKMKRRLLFYKLLAAASVAFAMGVAGVGYYTMSTTNVNDLQATSQEQPSQADPAGATALSSEAAAAQKAQQEPEQTSKDGLSTTRDPEEENAIASGTTQTDQQRSAQLSQPGLAASENPKGENTTASGATPSTQKSQQDQQRAGQLSSTGLATNGNSNGENAHASGTTSPGQKHQQDQQRSEQRSQAGLATTGNPKGENAIASGATSPTQKRQDEEHAGQLSQTDLAITGNSKGEDAVASGTASPGQKSQDEQRSQTGLATTGNPKGENTIASGTTSPGQKTQDEQRSEQRSQTSLATTGNPKGENAVASGTTAAAQQEQDQLLSISTSKGLPALVRLEKVVFQPAPAPEADPVALMMARLAEKERAMGAEEKEEKKKIASGEKLWTSVGLAAGGFNTVNGSVSSDAMASLASSSIADEQAKPSGVAYTIGVSVGTRLSKRWVLQGGVNYMNQSSNYTASGLVSSDFMRFSAASINNLDQINSLGAKEDTQYLATSPYGANNSLEFISVPLEAGYLLVNKKFGVQLNAGISTDLFVQNTITPEGDGVEKMTQGSGENSPYRTLNFSGLIGTEFSYKLGRHYRLAINPGLRYPINSIYKSDIGLEAMPLTFDVGLKFRYIFR